MVPAWAWVRGTLTSGAMLESSLEASQKTETELRATSGISRLGIPKDSVLLKRNSHIPLHCCSVLYGSEVDFFHLNFIN